MSKLSKEELSIELLEMHRGNICFILQGKSREEIGNILKASPQQKREKAYQQIRRLIEQSEPIPEDKLKEFVEYWVNKITDDIVTYKPGKFSMDTAMLKDMLQAYEALKGVKNE